jgi:ABC-2 type transport system permease protein
MSPAALAWQQFRLERKLFWRNPSAAFFSFVLPLMLLFLTASVFSADQGDLNVLIPGIAGISIMATTFNAMAFNVSVLREQGILKRLRGTPLPPASYFAGFLGNAVANAFVQVALVVVIGHLVYDVSWPQSWPELVIFTAAGVICFGSLGIALAHAIPNPDSAPAYVNAVFLPLMFISGAFYDSDSLPRGIRAVADVLPLTHLIDGLKASIVTGEGLSDAGGALAVIALWGAAGVVLAVRNFRWE